MANKQTKKPIHTPVTANNVSVNTKEEPKRKLSFKLEIPSLPGLTPYLPGILLFFIAVVICLFTYKDYGIAWDESLQRAGGLLSYNYVFHGDQSLLHDDYNTRGFFNFIPVGFELPLVIIEKIMNLTDPRDIYLMRHLVTHFLFLISALSLYILAYRLFKSRFIASLGFIMLVMAPRIYAHSFFNTKDLPFLSIFIITLTCCQYAFKIKKPMLFFLAGSLCGYATSIRNLGIILSGFILFFLIIDLANNFLNKENVKKTALSILLFSVGFCFTLYITWPYLWKAPIHNFVDTLNSFSRFSWNGFVLYDGKLENGLNLSWTYFPIWFLVSNPEIWLIAGFAGIVWVSIDFFKKPSAFLKNTMERNFLLYLLCFFAPIIIVIFLHSVIYNDWRHLYFVYPSFILLALYFINKIYQTRYKKIIQGICIIQIGLTSIFMILNHPFNQFYFNYFVSHKPEYLLENYDLDYWGCTYKQGLDYLIASDHSKVIKVNCKYKILLDNNIMFLPEDDRSRIQYAERENSDYFFPILRGVNSIYDDYSSIMVDSINILNSTVFCIFKEEKDPIKQKQVREKVITNFQKSLAITPDDTLLNTKIADAYCRSFQFDSAEVYIKRVLQLSPTSAIAIKNLVTIYIAREKYNEAILFLKQMMPVNPNLRNAYSNLAICYKAIKEYDSAILYYNKAITLEPDNFDFRRDIAEIYFIKEKYDSAMMHYKKYLEFKPNDATAINNLGVVYLQTKKYPEAIVQFKKAISINPNYLGAYSHLGSAYFNTQQYQEAIETYKREIMFDPKNSVNINNISICYQKMGKTDSVRKYETIAKQMNDAAKPR